MTSHAAPADHAIDLRTTCPRLREGLRFVAQCGRHGEPWFRMEDDLCNRFHRVGLAEYEFLLAIDGQRTVEQAREQAAMSTGHRRVLSADQAETLVLWAAEEGLLDGYFHPRHARNHTRSSSLAWVKIPLMHGNMAWRPLVKATGWLFSPSALAGSILLWVVASCVALLGQDRFVEDVSVVFSANGWLMLAGVWLVLKIVHELGHLVCCQYHGGRVGEVGMAWMLIAPVAYVDLTDLYRMESRGKRVFTCLAGIYVELTIAALSVLAWSCTDSAAASHLLATVAVTASAGSLLFNLNPLMRLDGYHAVCDWIGRPHLGAEGAKAMQAAVAKIALGRNRPVRSSGMGLTIYGIAVVVYQVAVSLGLVAAAFSMYGRVGLLIVSAAMLVIAIPALTRLWRAINQERRSRPAVIVRLALSLLVLTAVLSAAWQGFGTWRSGWWGVVDYAHDAPLRCASAGKVIRVWIEAGQQVQRGDRLLELENLSLRNEWIQAQCELAAGESRWKQLRESSLPAEAASEQKANEAIRTRLAHLQRQVDGLVLRAPRDGIVIASDLEHWNGRWFREGDAVLHVVDETKKKIVAAVPQSASDQISGAAGAEISCRSHDGSLIRAVVTSITQQADLAPPHPALAATAGGPLAVRPEIEQEEVVLLSPHLRLEAAVADREHRLFPGQFVKIQRRTMDFQSVE
ncbi:MAG: HlyD family efflux transporter periplasmic adaptor subunit [Planctomycetaceae bacterium]